MCKRAFLFQGQVCISLQRVCIHEELYDRFIEKFVSETKKLILGDPLDQKTDVSALITPADIKRSLNWIDEAKNSGAKIVTGGIADGNILHPTIILEADSKLKISCQEVFAPIVLVNKVNSVDEAIAK